MLSHFSLSSFNHCSLVREQKHIAWIELESYTIKLTYIQPTNKLYDQEVDETNKLHQNAITSHLLNLLDAVTQNSHLIVTPLKLQGLWLYIIIQK